MPAANFDTPWVTELIRGFQRKNPGQILDAQSFAALGADHPLKKLVHHVSLGLSFPDIPRKRLSRAVVPVNDLPPQHLEQAGFLPSKVAVPERGQTQLTTYRHPYSNLHFHRHGEDWIFHNDAHPSAQMLYKRKLMDAEQAGQPLGAGGKAVAAAKSYGSGMKHVLLEGVPGYAGLAGSWLTAKPGFRDMARGVRDPLSPLRATGRLAGLGFAGGAAGSSMSRSLPTTDSLMPGVYAGGETKMASTQRESPLMSQVRQLEAQRQQNLSRAETVQSGAERGGEVLGGIGGAYHGQAMGRSAGGVLGEKIRRPLYRSRLAQGMQQNRLADYHGGLLQRLQDSLGGSAARLGSPETSAINELAALQHEQTPRVDLRSLSKLKFMRPAGKVLGTLAGAGAGLLGGGAIGKEIGRQAAEPNPALKIPTAMPSPPKLASDNPVWDGFLSGCLAVGLNAQQVKEAVDRVSDEFPEAAADLRAGLEKSAASPMTFLQPFMRPAARAGQALAKPGVAQQAGSMGFGGLMGSMTGDDLAGGGQSAWSVPRLAGMATGAAMGHRGFARSGVGRSLQQPFGNAWKGSLAGSVLDTAAGLADYDTGGAFGTAGAYGGIGLGMAHNKARNVLQATAGPRAATNRATSMIPGLASSTRAAPPAWAGHVMGAQKGLNNIATGAMEPLKAVGRGAVNLGNRFMGRPGAAAPSWLQATRTAPGMQSAMKTYGALTTAVPLAGTAYGLGSQALNGAVNNKLSEGIAAGGEHMNDVLDRYMAEHGMMGGDGQFDPFAGMKRKMTNGANRGADSLMSLLGFGGGGGGAQPIPGAGLYGVPQGFQPGVGGRYSPAQAQEAARHWQTLTQGGGQGQGRNELEAQRSGGGWL